MAKYLGIPLQVASGTTVTATYGSPELVVDGDFPSPNVNWTFAGGATLQSNGAKIDNTVTGANAYIAQELTNSPNGKRFELTYDVILTNGTTLALELFNNLNLNTATIGTNRKITFTWDKVSEFLTIKRITSGTNVTIDNVSLKEVQYNYLQVVGGDLLKESKVGDVVFNSTDDNEAVVVQVINNDTLLLSNDILSDAGDAFSIFAPNGDTRGNQILRIDNYIISEYDEATSAPNQSSFWFAAGPQADKVTLQQLNNAVNTYFVADVIERFVQRLNAQSATASRLDIPLNEFRDHKYNQVLTTTAITLS